jgi:hypothetical protein
LAETKTLVVFVGRKKKSVNIDRSISAEVQRVAGLINGMRTVLIKLFVILFFNVVFRLEPDCLDRVDPLAIQAEWE